MPSDNNFALKRKVMKNQWFEKILWDKSWRCDQKQVFLQKEFATTT